MDKHAAKASELKSIFSSFNLQEIEQAITSLEDLREQKLSLQQNVNPADPKPLDKKIVVVGGRGQLGRLFVNLFIASGYQVCILESEDWSQAESMLDDAALVLIAVPIQFTQKVISQLVKLPRECILADVTSVKSKPLEAMLAQHDGPVIGLHPMFGPDVKNFKGQTIVCCHGRDEDGCEWLVKQLKQWQANCHFIEAAKHDQAMALIQVLRHFSTVAYGAHLAQEDPDLNDVLALSSPIYRLELAMVGRLFAQDPNLYTEIIFANKDNLSMMERYIQQYQMLLEKVIANDKQAFKLVFAQTRSWFGEYADKFLKESGELLRLANGSRKGR